MLKMNIWEHFQRFLGAPIWSGSFDHPEASGGCFRLDVGLIWGLGLGSRARYAILEKIVPRLGESKIFGVPRGQQKEHNIAPKPASSCNLAPRASWGPLGLEV